MLDQTQLEHFRNLVSLIAADGKIDEVEKVALSKIAYQHGIPLERFNIMLKKAHEYQYLIPQNQKEREKQLQQMIEVAKLDGEFCKAELELIIMVGEKLGFTRQELDQIIAAHS
ncbi:MAG TPA: TerB family tellurite resistance protein [Chryseosolibacter sp.]|nr:TerB family tellurite resistance protein [Chryseosolibacter sp.]